MAVDETTNMEPIDFTDDEPIPLSGNSIVDVFRQELKELTETKEVYIPVRGYEGTGLQIKYRMPESGAELDAIGRKVSRQAKGMYQRNLNASLDTIIALCEGIYVQPEGVEEPVMLDPRNTGEPVQFDMELAEIMGMEFTPGEPPNSRAIVKRLFGGNDLAVLNHAEKLYRWVQNVKTDVAQEMWETGES